MGKEAEYWDWVRGRELGWLWSCCWWHWYRGGIARRGQATGDDCRPHVEWGQKDREVVRMTDNLHQYCIEKETDRYTKRIDCCDPPPSFSQ